MLLCLSSEYLGCSAKRKVSIRPFSTTTLLDLIQLNNKSTYIFVPKKGRRQRSEIDKIKYHT